MKIFTVRCPVGGPISVSPHLLVKPVRTGLSHYIYLFQNDWLRMEIPALIKENEESCWITNCLVSSPSKGPRPLIVEDKLAHDPRYKHDVLVYLETWSLYPCYLSHSKKPEPLWYWMSDSPERPHRQALWRLRPGEVLCPNLGGQIVEITNKGGDIQVMCTRGTVAYEPPLVETGEKAKKKIIIPFRTPAQPTPEEQPPELERPLTLWKRIKLKLTHFLQFLQRMFQSIG